MVTKRLFSLFFSLCLVSAHELTGQAIPDTVTAQQSIMAEVGGKLFRDDKPIYP